MGEEAVTPERLFGSRRSWGVLHALRRIPDGPLVALCDASLVVTREVGLYTEEVGWRVCDRKACENAQTEERLRLGIICDRALAGEEER